MLRESSSVIATEEVQARKFVAGELQANLEPVYSLQGSREVAVDRHYGSEMRPSRPVIMYAYLASPSRRISAL